MEIGSPAAGASADGVLPPTPYESEMVDGLRVNDLGVELGLVLQTRYDRFSLEAPPPREGEVRGAVAIVADGAGGILLVHRTDNHLLGLPGGRMNPGEAPAATAVRETQEEAGLTVRVVGDFGSVDPGWTFRYPVGLPDWNRALDAVRERSDDPDRAVLTKEDRWALPDRQTAGEELRRLTNVYLGVLDGGGPQEPRPSEENFSARFYDLGEITERAERGLLDPGDFGCVVRFFDRYPDGKLPLRDTAAADAVEASES